MRGLDVEVGADRAKGEWPCVDVMEINRPDDLADIASLGLTLAEAKQLLAGFRQDSRRHPIVCVFGRAAACGYAASRMSSTVFVRRRNCTRR